MFIAKFATAAAFVLSLQTNNANAVASDPEPVFPLEWSASMIETTWFRGELQQTPGSVVYSWPHETQIIRRQESRLNPMCNNVRLLNADAVALLRSAFS